MTKGPCILITGANGEIGTSLVEALAARGASVIALDLRPVRPELAAHCLATRTGSITDKDTLTAIGREFPIDSIFHLAALLSTRSEAKPDEAHEVNVGGTLNLLHTAVEAALAHGRIVKFFFPSSIAVYGVPDRAVKGKAGAVKEDEWLRPATMYGCNKLYCEHLGRYFADHYRRNDPEIARKLIDFRGIRFPGLISAHTMPSGGTSDYGPEMIHAAAQGIPYESFVREDSKIPFMAMPDAIRAILELMDAPAVRLTQAVYNISAFAPTAGDFAAAVRQVFPGAKITWKPNPARQWIVDSWPEDCDAASAAVDWSFQPAYGWERTFHEYLVANIRKRYAAT